MATIIESATSLASIDALAKAYAQARSVLSERVSDLEKETAEIHRRRIGGIKSAAATATDLQAQLRSAIEGAPELFVRPRTFCLHGIKVGYQKGKGKLDWDDNAKVVGLIRKHLPEQAEVLIITEEIPSADAMANLDVKALARIGVRCEGTGDQVVIKASDTAVDKFVKKLLSEGAKAVEGSDD